MKALFQNRTEAGTALAGLLGRHAGLGTIVLGVDEGGTMVAAELARWLGAPFDRLPVEVFELPCDKRTLLGAVAPGGICVLDDELVDLLDVEADSVSALRREAEAVLEERNRLLRGERPLPRVEGRTVVLVADLIASTLRIRAALLYLRQHDPLGVVIAAPAATEAAVRELRPLASELVVVHRPDAAPPVNAVYACADPPGDSEVRRVLGVGEAVAEDLSPTAMND